MNAHAETLQRNLSALQRTTVKQKDEINRLWRKVERLTAEKAALLADLKILRTEKHADAEAIGALRDDLEGMRAEGKRMRREVEISRNDALRQALSHKWLCFHKCDEEIEVVNADDITALIEGDTND